MNLESGDDLQYLMRPSHAVGVHQNCRYEILGA